MVEASPIAARIGLISDTHMPGRLAELPPALPEALRGVDLVLHAGDVGELRVLDALSRIAPVVAVHGNDDTEEARRELPYRQVITVGGTRILLTHSHEPDREAELAQRRGDAWGPKLERRAAMGRRSGASIVVYGHTHVPMARTYHGVLLVNPGALASPNAYTRQRVRTVAILSIPEGSEPNVVHSDLAAPDQAFAPEIDWDRGFRAALGDHSESILDPDLAARWEQIERLARSAGEESSAFRACEHALLRVAHRCWSGERQRITPGDLLAELDREPELGSASLRQIREVLSESGGATAAR